MLDAYQRIMSLIEYRLEYISSEKVAETVFLGEGRKATLNFL
jgi:hypothetical protein